MPLVCLRSREFPGSPVVRIPTFTAVARGSIPGQGTEIPQDVGVAEGKKKAHM